MQIAFASLLVDDQARAHDFYTRVLGFTVAHDIPMGPHRWLTVTSPEGKAGVEVVLEPLAFPPARAYQKALFEAGIPATAFISADLDAEVARLKTAGVVFRQDITEAGPVRMALFEDTCGNLINLVQPKA